MENLDKDKIEKVLAKVYKLLNKHNLTVSELIVFYGNLGYHIGASMAGFEGQGPGIDELNKQYYTDPTVDVGMMLQGLLICGWQDDWEKTKRLSKWETKDKEKTE